MAPALRITFLGTGTSVGVPMVGCGCGTCTSEDPKDKRLRSSILCQAGETQWVVDTGPDFRTQCLRAGITSLDAAVYTHSHMDHVLGFDEMRRFTLGADASIPIYARAETLDALKRMFDYAFNGENRYPGYLKPDPFEVNGAFEIGGVQLTPVPVSHGKVDTVGYVFSINGRKLFGYLPDCKEVSDEGMEILEGVEHLVVDALRFREHPTHMNFDEALALVRKLQPEASYFTHFTCDVRHSEAEKTVPDGVYLAFDGMVLELH